MAQGGGFVQGFAGNAVGAAAGLVSQDAFGPVGSPDGFLQRTAVAAIGGGLAAEITGGKFANGAVTAAFAHMLNAEAGRMLGALGTGYVGTALGTGVAGICAYVTAGGCVTAGPYIVTGGAMIGRAVGGALGSAVEDWVFSDDGPPNTDDLIKDAQARYPNKAGKFEAHHEDPKYMGGDPKGATRRIDAAYHQDITNEFRRHHGYGLGNLPEAQRKLIMDEVYKKFPLP